MNLMHKDQYPTQQKMHNLEKMVFSLEKAVVTKKY